MTDVRIRNVDDWVVEWHRRRAKQEGRSLEKELRGLLTAVALESKKAIAQEMRADLDLLRKKYGQFSSSTDAIRKERERRG